MRLELLNDTKELDAYIFYRLIRKKDVNVSTMKLQKLVYLIQGMHLAHFGEPLFPEEPVVNTYGPKYKSIERRYTSLHVNLEIRWHMIKKDKLLDGKEEYRQADFLLTNLTAKQKYLINDTIDVFAHLDAIDCMTVVTSMPLIISITKNYKKSNEIQTITNDQIKNDFKTMIQSGRT